MGGAAINVYRFIVHPRQTGDPRSSGYLSDAHALGLKKIIQIRASDLYFIEGNLNEAQLDRLAGELLSDPLTQRVEYRQLQSVVAPQSNFERQFSIEVTLRPGVTDPVAEQIVRAAGALGIAGVRRASTGQHFLVEGNKLNQTVLHTLAKRLLANPVIQCYALGEIEPNFPEQAEASSIVETIPIRAMSPQELGACSRERRAALDLAEMRAIQDYFLKIKRECTDVEFETIAQTWSEHCVHKTFKARVTVDESNGNNNPYPPMIDNIFKTYIRRATEQINAPWVISAFTDNAGIIEFDGQNELSFKVETHNHPSAIEPFGGANTGVGGVIRDVMGVSARPIAATDILCFGPQDLPVAALPEGVLHPRRIQSGVVAGVQDYGNKMGIPTVNGAIWYDPGFTSNPLVFCGCLGIAPRNKHRHQPENGDHVIILGGRTGRDGLRGATFSSMAMDAQTGDVAGASVQIGAPITEKGVLEVTLKARDADLYNAITDCGAGGLSSAVGEMANRIGAEVDIALVRLKYPGLAPWEIWLSEAQERMVLAVPPANLSNLQELCAIYDVELTDIGTFTGSQKLVVKYGSKVVLELDNTFLHEGIPQRQLIARAPNNKKTSDRYYKSPKSNSNIETTLLMLLAHPNIASKENVIRIYDHEVQGATVVKPLTGVQNDGPSDACVLKPLDSPGNAAVALSNGINPEYGKLDAYCMALSVVDEAVRNVVAVGANPERIAILDNFCWGDPLRLEVMWSLIEAGRGCYEAAIAYQAPFISGKDSFNNEYLGSDSQRHSIPPTLLISALGLIEDHSRAITMDFKRPGDMLFLVGEFQPTFGGSHFDLISGTPSGMLIPSASAQAPQVYRRLHQAITNNLVRACHDLSEGGLAVTLAEMSIGGRLGAQIKPPPGETQLVLFGETNGCLVAEIDPKNCAKFETIMADQPYVRIGEVIAGDEMVISYSDQALLSLPVNKLLSTWSGNPPG